MTEEPEEIEVITASPRPRKINHETDSFSLGITKLDGIDVNIKRKASRLEKKYESNDGGVESKQLEPQIFTAYSTMDLMQPPNNVEYLAALYNLSPVLRAAVQAKASAMVGLGYDLVESEKTLSNLEDTDEDKLPGKRKKLRKAKTLTVERLEACNAEMTFTEIMTRVMIDSETIGYGCLEIGRRNTGEIGYIGHIPAKTVRVRRKRDGYVQIIADKAVFFRNFGDTTTPNPIGGDQNPNEILFFMPGNYSPEETYYGIPPSVAAKQAIAGNEFSARFNLDYFENKALPRYVFVVKGAKLSANSNRELTEFFETMRGENHRTLIVPLPPDSVEGKHDFQMHPVETGVQDSSFMNYRRGNMQEILMAYRVPANKIGMSDGIDNSSARDMSKNFNETVTRPEQKNIERRINRIITEWTTDIFKFQFKSTALSDETELSKQDQVYLTLGTLTPNDIRVSRWGMAPLENGDKTITELQAQFAQEQSDKTAEMQANAAKTRARDTERAANTSDSTGNARNPKGEGRQQA